MKCDDKILIIFVTFITLYMTSARCDETGRPCPYFGGERVSAPHGNLVNCSWYADNACCQRTEVTSVFRDMYALYGASPACANYLNYLMCYFCSPEQYKWYNGRARVCSTYCESLFDACKMAAYNGQALGVKYTSGDAFCSGQKFEVADTSETCFDFDPDVFAKAPILHTLSTVVIVIILQLLWFSQLFIG